VSSISGIGSSEGTSILQQLQKAAQSAIGSTEGSGSGEDSFEVSGPGELLAKLKKLQEEDPEKFQEITAELAEKVKSAAEEATGMDKEMLSELAENLTTASETGDLSALQPKEPPAPPAGGMPPAEGTNGTKGLETYQQVASAGKGGSKETMDALFKNLSSYVDEALAAYEDEESLSV
jgi:hypothetical protein